jgi:tetratricopeptide (TPR) repeat protein
MAAPSQSSPNQASQSTNAESTESAAPVVEQPVQAPLKDPPFASLKDPYPPVAALKDPPPPAPSPQLTYTGTQTSDSYLLAKHLLKEGDFDNALETIGMALETTASRLPEDADADVHEAMAPLYYLYGTTLLYSMEESSDVQTGGMTMNPDNQGEGEEEEEEQPEDSQIAWENLEAARHILNHMVSTNDSQDLRLDLAQVQLRLGDLQRGNGAYPGAIADYTSCLEIRQPILGMYSRKVAEVYHLLGTVYMALASEGDKQSSEEGGEDTMTPEQIEENRSLSIQNYVACGKSFAGQIAFLCGADPEVITLDASEEEQGGKTTGMDAAELAMNASSRTIRAIRERVKDLHASGEEDEETVHEFKEMLDEIQETIDEAEISKEGIKEVSEMKAKAKADVAALDGIANADGSTTTIGFVNPMVEATAIAQTVATSAQPMMVVKKKEKRKEQDSKMPAQEDTKRVKTDE